MCFLLVTKKKRRKKYKQRLHDAVERIMSIRQDRIYQLGKIAGYTEAQNKGCILSLNVPHTIEEEFGEYL